MGCVVVSLALGVRRGGAPAPNIPTAPVAAASPSPAATTSEVASRLRLPRPMTPPPPPRPSPRARPGAYANIDPPTTRSRAARRAARLRRAARARRRDASATRACRCTRSEQARVRRAAGGHLRARPRQHRLRPDAAAHLPDGARPRVVRAHRAGGGRARRYASPVVRIDQLGTYSCREMAAYPGWVSEHAYANAIDLARFTLRNGVTLAVERDFDKGRRRPGAQGGRLPAHRVAAGVRRGGLLARADAVLRRRRIATTSTWTWRATGATARDRTRSPRGDQLTTGRRSIPGSK